jgi:hypothetical protein
MVPPSIRLGTSQIPTSPPHVVVPTSGPIFRILNIYGSMSPPEPHFINDHYFWSPNPCVWCCKCLLVPSGIIKITKKISWKHICDVIGNLSPWLNRSSMMAPFFVLLGKIVTVEICVASLYLVTKHMPTCR